VGGAGLVVSCLAIPGPVANRNMIGLERERERELYRYTLYTHTHAHIGKSINMNMYIQRPVRAWW